MIKQLTLVFALTACDRGMDDARCRKETQALTALLRQANSDPPRFYTHEAKLVVRNDLPRQQIEQRPVVLLIAPGLWRLQFKKIATAEELANELKGLHEATGSNRIYLVIDQATQWRYVVDAVEAAEHAG